MRNTILTWAQVASHLSGQPQHTFISLQKSQVEHPHGAGMRRSLGLPVGQIADWRVAHPNCHGLHVREYVDRYTAHLDHVNPNCDLPGHIASDVPIVAGTAALGALVGLALGESPGAMFLGALIGGAIGAAAAASAEAAATAPKPRKA